MAANSEVLSRICLKFKLVRDIIDVLVTCRYEEDPIKTEGARVLTRLYDIFSVAQGQLTPQSLVESQALGVWTDFVLFYDYLFSLFSFSSVL